MTTEGERLRAIFTAPGWARLIATLQSYRDSGRPLPSTVSLPDATRDERERHAALLRLGRPSKADRLSYEIADISRALEASGLPSNWNVILSEVCGPIPKQAVEARAAEEAWHALWGTITADLAANPFLCAPEWLHALRSDGVLRRLTSGNAAIAFEIVNAAARLLRLFPLSEEQALAEVAAQNCGDSHALDPDRALSTVVLRGLAVRNGVTYPSRANERRELWAMAGVICDELSAPVLTFNLRLDGGFPAPVLAAAWAAREPVHLTTRMLLATHWNGIQVPQRVFVCENPAVIAIAATRLGNRCAPLVCVDGEPKTAAWLLLRALRARGVSLHYHGDFDWAGVAIAGRVIDKVGALPWRFDDVAFGEACKLVGRPLKGTPVSTGWCPKLADAMSKARKAYDEESLIGALLSDLVESGNP